MNTVAVTVVDHGASNLRSIVGSLRALGARCSVVDSPGSLRTSKAIVLPGVGSFKSAMSRMSDSGMKDGILEAIASGSRVLGVCLGMQLLGDWSDEEGGSQGIGIAPITSRRFVAPRQTTLRIPHMGFNSVRAVGESILFKGIPTEGDFYFAHSYRVASMEMVNGVAGSTTEYGGTFVSALEIDESVFGVQFHPELSQGNGLRLLANFLQHASC